MTETQSNNRHSNIKDLLGQRFTRLLVIGLSPERTKYGQCRWICVCDCGNKKTITSTHLVGGRIVSCGCHKDANTRLRFFKHGLKHTPEYNSWRAARNRCFCKNVTGYSNYGGRGITISQEWRDSFLTFLTDMGPRPDGYTLERIDVNGNYEKSNCCWLPKPEQSRNMRCTVRITHDGMTLTLHEWSLHTGINIKTLRSRRQRGLFLFTQLPEQKKIPPNA